MLQKILIMERRNGLYASWLFAGILIIISCKPGNKTEGEQLGEIAFAATGADKAQPAFTKGMLLLHSFEYEDAAEAFREAITIDSNFTMAYWGEVMTCNHPLWQEQDLEKGNAILNELAESEEARLAMAKTNIEKDFLKGVHILFGQGNKAERDSGYSAYMKSLYEKYPGNNEVAGFYSLSLIGWAITGNEISVSEEAAKVAMEILDRNPQHPGALHYIIHAYDHPAYAAKALEVANKYAGVAPAAAHALHMPTHTYVALGLWDQVVSSNEVSWAASIARKNRKQLNNDALGYHSYHWLEYGYLQKGENEKARIMLDSMRGFARANPSPKARGHVVLLQTTYLGETNDYTPETIANEFNTGDLNIGLRSAQQFVNGVNAYRQKDAEALSAIIRKMTGERLIDAERLGEGGLRICGNISRSLPTETNLLQSEAMEAELKALQAMLDNNDVLAEQWMKTATQLEAKSGYSYGPPNIVKPSYEMYGEWLLQKGRADEALQQFETSLKFAPNRTLSIKGKMEAEKLVKDASMALR
jgi:tetratricopeptide (TPR) repeat protein